MLINILSEQSTLAGSSPLGASASMKPASVSEGFREETSTLAVVDVAELNVLYRNLSSYQPEPAMTLRWPRR